MSIWKKIALILVALAAGLAAIVAVTYVTNTAPVLPSIPAAEAANGKPYVVKLHAQWCPICMLTKGVWSEIEQSYQGRAHLLVLDFTDDATTAASRAEAARLDLSAFFDEFEGSTGPIAVLDGRTHEVQSVISGSRDFADYRAAIDAALNAAP